MQVLIPLWPKHVSPRVVLGLRTSTAVIVRVQLNFAELAASRAAPAFLRKYWGCNGNCLCPRASLWVGIERQSCSRGMPSCQSGWGIWGFHLCLVPAQSLLVRTELLPLPQRVRSNSQEGCYREEISSYQCWSRSPILPTTEAARKYCHIPGVIYVALKERSNSYQWH